ncbi:hypothetical protein [Fulvimarina endophytica]|uniref:hypothetical protein n=1 Tax=Fulvimarina endophytica TaxID=2293836 RepID=UPI001314B34D|nr:hypothetical protein [Fulvimarina endophytica]
MSTLDAHKIRQFLAEWSAEIRTDRAINSLRRCRIDLLQEEIERLRKDLDINLAA